MTEEEAHLLADAAAREARRDLSQYDAPRVHKDDDGWSFLYVLKHPTVGAHFRVVVDAARTVRILPGR